MHEPASPTAFSPIERLAPEHRLDQFSSGSHRVDYWLKKTCSSKSGETQFTCDLRGSHWQTCGGLLRINGGEVALEKCPPHITAGMPTAFPVPVMKLVWLGVDEKYQGKGLAKALMKDAFLRTLQVAELAGVRAIVVDAIDADAKAFYEKNSDLNLPRSAITNYSCGSMTFGPQSTQATRDSDVARITSLIYSPGRIGSWQFRIAPLHAKKESLPV